MGKESMWLKRTVRVFSLFIENMSERELRKRVSDRKRKRGWGRKRKRERGGGPKEMERQK